MTQSVKRRDADWKVQIQLQTEIFLFIILRAPFEPNLPPVLWVQEFLCLRVRMAEGLN